MSRLFPSALLSNHSAHFSHHKNTQLLRFISELVEGWQFPQCCCLIADPGAAMSYLIPLWSGSNRSRVCFGSECILIVGFHWLSELRHLLKSKEETRLGPNLVQYGLWSSQSLHPRCKRRWHLYPTSHGALCKDGWVWRVFLFVFPHIVENKSLNVEKDISSLQNNWEHDCHKYW